MRSVYYGVLVVCLSLCALGGTAAGKSWPSGLTAAWKHEIEKSPKAQSVPYDVKLWAKALVEAQPGAYRDSLHNWSTISKKMPKRLRTLADVTYLALLWQEGLAQTFVEQMLRKVRRKAFRKSAHWKEFASSPAIASGGLANFLWDNAVILGAQERAALKSLPWQEPFTALKSLALLRRGKSVGLVLTKVSSGIPWRDKLELTYVLSLARKGKTQEAVERVSDLLESSSGSLTSAERHAYELQLARLYFQAADLDKAEQVYEKLSKASAASSSLNLSAYEELLWVWFRKGDTSRLRGAIEVLRRADAETHFMPELFAIRAMSSLKLCYYDQAKRDFQDFLTFNKIWAHRIDAARNNELAPAPNDRDWYTRYLEKAIPLRATELKRIKVLHQESIAATLPSVGKQQHWVQLEKRLESALQRLQDNLQAEYRRHWTNQAMALQEAIRKMRFVKIELLSQLDEHRAKPDSIRSKENATRAEQDVAQGLSDETDWSFPFDGVVWPDERFATRSTAHNICL